MKHTKADHNSKKDVNVESEEIVNNQGNESSEATSPDEVLVENELDAVKKALEELQTKYNQLNDTYLRSLAEFDNYRKRSVREKADLIKSGGEKVLINILDVVDDMDRGLAATKDAQDVEAVKQGMDLIYNKLQAFLKQNNVTVIETEGKPFDTDLHEAITTIPAPDEELRDKVVDCVQKGYYLNEKVIRFAKVVVGK